MDQSLQWPPGLRPMEDQVAGHTFQIETESIGLLQDETAGCVLKPLGKPDCREREVSFYNEIYNTKDPLLASAKHLLPVFYEEVKLVANNRSYVFIKLEDLTHGMARPCIMDVKVGKRTWDPEASAEKRAVEEEKYAACKQALGLCIPGFQVYTADTSGGQCTLKRYGKDYGKQMRPENFIETLGLFLNTKPVKCKPLIEEVLRQLFAIRQWFNDQRVYNFYASSLLITYDFDKMQAMIISETAGNGNLLTNGDVQHDESSGKNTCNETPTASGSSHKTSIIANHKNGSSATQTPPQPLATISTPAKDWVKVRMIDFAHVYKTTNETLDSNYIFGLQNLIEMIEELLIQ